MNREVCSLAAKLVAICFVMLAVSSANADSPADSKATPQPEMKLPPGWTMEDMQACVIAGMPGKMHELLAKDIGTWRGKCVMWMAPDTDPVSSDTTMTVSSAMGGRFMKSDLACEIPGFGPYTGTGMSGFDNVSQQLVSTWIDNQSTGIMNGTGELSPDGKTLTWKFNFNCPLTKKPAVMRQVETNTGPNSKKVEMFGPDPKTGKEYKSMSIELTRK